MGERERTGHLLFVDLRDHYGLTQIVADTGVRRHSRFLANNGYEVVNLGIKVPPDVLIQACMEHHPDAIGLSGLLVKSTAQMVITATDLKAAGILAPMLVGGAALSERFTRTKIAPAYGEAVCYAKDAMTGLSLMNRLMDPAERDAVLASHTFTEAPAGGGSSRRNRSGR